MPSDVGAGQLARWGSHLPRDAVVGAGAEIGDGSRERGVLGGSEG